MMIGHAAEQAATRYLVSVYALNPARRPDAHIVVCIMLHKGLLSDDGLRAFIEQHINTATAPELALGPDELMQTMSCAILTSACVMPALYQQLRDYCNGSQAIRFQEPLLDGAGYTIGFLSMGPADWEHTREIADKLAEALQRDTDAYAEQ